MPIGILTINVKGTSIEPKERQLLAHPKIGGLALFRGNWLKEHENPKVELKKLIAEARSINPNLIVMVDHEGGKIWRFDSGFTKLPSAKIYGELYDKEGATVALKYAYEQAYLLASELLECGIDISLAPVVDLDGESDVIGKLERAFHQDPQVVVEIAEQFIKGMNDAGMPATLKHFPGHGTCQQDSHTLVPVDNRGLNSLQRDLLPFKTLINKNLKLAIMSNHVIYPAVDKENVAGFSNAWLKGCLRMGLGFNGLIMSDCLSMKGADIGTIFSRIKKAEEAGNDLILVTHQHGENLDELLAILDKVPDNQEAAQRRKQFVATLKRSIKQSDLGVDGENSLLRADAKELGVSNINTQSVVQDNSRFNTHKGIV